MMLSKYQISAYYVAKDIDLRRGKATAMRKSPAFRVIPAYKVLELISKFVFEILTL